MVIKLQKDNMSFKRAAFIATATVFKILILLVILALIIGTARIIIDAAEVFNLSIDRGFEMLITDILGMVVVLELFRGLMDYFELQRVRITHMAEVTLIFVLREVMISLYQHKLMWEEMAAMAVLIAVLGGLRTMAIIKSPDFKGKEENA